MIHYHQHHTNHGRAYKQWIVGFNSSPLAGRVAFHMPAPRRQSGPHKVLLVELGHHEAEEQYSGPRRRIRQGHFGSRQKGTLTTREFLQNGKLRLRFYVVYEVLSPHVHIMYQGIHDWKKRKYNGSHNICLLYTSPSPRD